MKTYLSFGDIELLTNEAKSIRDKLLIRLLSRLGCRISELLPLNIEKLLVMNTVSGMIICGIR